MKDATEPAKRDDARSVRLACWIAALFLAILLNRGAADGQESGPALPPPARLPPPAKLPQGLEAQPAMSNRPMKSVAPAAKPVAQAAQAEPMYRSIAAYAEDPGIGGHVTNNVQVSPSRIDMAEEGPGMPVPVMAEPGEIGYSTNSFSDGNECSLFWSEPLCYEFLPPNLLWEVPLANQREPRLGGRFTNARKESTIDTAIGAEFGFVSFRPKNKPNEGFQLDGLAAVFTRFNERRLLTAADYRAGLPLTYAKGPWQAKIGYEHTSTHLGDEFIGATGRTQVAHVRDEIVVGLARRFWDQFRLYGQAGYSFLTSDVIGENRGRFDWGLEWSRRFRTDWKGQPFAAFDMDIRSDQDYNPNITVQVGWQWRERIGHSGRIAFEAYNGKSPYGQFFRDHEDWMGVVFLYDW